MGCCDYVCRLRPLCEWSAMSRGHDSPVEWLVANIDVLAEFRRRYPDLVGGCQPVKLRIVQSGYVMLHWLQSGHRHMALHRAQFLPLGLSAIMHRIVCPSPGRDCLLIVRARGYFPRALNSYCIGGAGAQFRTQWPHLAFAHEHDRLVDLTRIVFCFRGGRLESFACSGRPALIVLRFGPACSKRF